MKALRAVRGMAILGLLGLAPLRAEIAEMQSQLLKPCLKVETDVGETPAERKTTAKRYATRIAETSDFFLKMFQIKAEQFVEYATVRNSVEQPWNTEIRIRVFRNYDEFLKDFQQRYETKTIPGAFFGIKRDKDEYGHLGPWFREIGAHADGISEEAVLRHLYHEMGHLFMRTYMFWPVEVPSWIEEGTAELFQYRKNNGTKPEAERQERLGWLMEMVTLEENSLGASVDWKDFTGVRNAHNLDFTHLDPLRSTVQYVQAWSVMEFMIDSPQRGAAFTKLLGLIKSTAEAANIEGQRKGLKGEAFGKHIDDTVYKKQYELFRTAYGRDVLDVETIWKEWVTKTGTTTQKREPELYYHRGIWHLAYRARFAKDAEQKLAILAQAEQIFQAGIAASPKTPESYVGMGRLAMVRKDLEATGQWFAKAAELGTENFEALLYGGVASIQSGKPAAAIDPLRKAVEQRPNHYEARLQLGHALAFALQEAVDKVTSAEALLHLEGASELRPEDRAWPELLAGVVLWQQGDYQPAHIRFLRAQMGLPGDPRPLLFDCAALIANNEREQAIQVLTAAATGGDRYAKRMQELLATGWRPRLGFDERGQPGVYGLTMPDPTAEKSATPGKDTPAEGGAAPPEVNEDGGAGLF